MQRPLVVDIVRGSTADGPGLRSVVFFKGCPLACDFCHNPEARDPRAEVAFRASACVDCGRCAEACPQSAIALGVPGRIERTVCEGCGVCVDECVGGALRRIGRYYSPEDLAAVLGRDVPYYRHSGGGVTLTGGECTLYPEYLERLLRLLRDEAIHVAIETSGFFRYDAFRDHILPWVDLIYFDLKIADDAAHRQVTGVSNRTIHENLRRLLAEPDVRVLVRTPLVPGVTATPENLAGIVRILAELGAEGLTLLPYNPMGFDAYETLGRPRPELPKHFMSAADEAQVRETVTALLAEACEIARRPPSGGFARSGVCCEPCGIWNRS